MSKRNPLPPVGSRAAGQCSPLLCSNGVSAAFYKYRATPLAMRILNRAFGRHFDRRSQVGASGESSAGKITYPPRVYPVRPQRFGRGGLSGAGCRPPADGDRCAENASPGGLLRRVCRTFVPWSVIAAESFFLLPGGLPFGLSQPWTRRRGPPRGRFPQQDPARRKKIITCMADTSLI
jgi:hypothetical protein